MIQSRWLLALLAVTLISPMPLAHDVSTGAGPKMAPRPTSTWKQIAPGEEDKCIQDDINKPMPDESNWYPGLILQKRTCELGHGYLWVNPIVVNPPDAWEKTSWRAGYILFKDRLLTSDATRTTVWESPDGTFLLFLDTSTNKLVLFNAMSGSLSAVKGADNFGPAFNVHASPDGKSVTVKLDKRYSFTNKSRTIRLKLSDYP